jgi:hypothetical protein
VAGRQEDFIAHASRKRAAGKDGAGHEIGTMANPSAAWRSCVRAGAFPKRSANLPMNEITTAFSDKS